MAGDYGTIRCTLKEHRRRKKLSQEELAHLVGVKRQAIYDMEAGCYLPNTAIALRLARALGCTVERLFIEDDPSGPGRLRLLNSAGAGVRLSLARVRERLVGIPLSGACAMPFRVESADGFLTEDKTIDYQVPEAELARTLIILGCDPALSLLGGLLARAAPGFRAHIVFASSRKALLAVHEGDAHIAGIHYHGLESADGNIEAVRALSPALECLVVTFSWQEEGFMVAAGNPLNLRRAEDIERVRFVNREEGVRKLLDTRRSGRPASAARDYVEEEVYSHSEGALRVAKGTADAALGLRMVAESFGLDFVPLAVTRYDLVIPSDLRDHEGVSALLDVLKSSRLKKELAALPGYDPSDTGKVILG